VTLGLGSQLTSQAVSDPYVRVFAWAVRTLILQKGIAATLLRCESKEGVCIVGANGWARGQGGKGERGRGRGGEGERGKVKGVQSAPVRMVARCLLEEQPSTDTSLWDPPHSNPRSTTVRGVTRG
jgi:hypothetical protein